ncbi:MAG TPA: D-alanine--D-alanine ligase family protein [Candidatus Limnocylindria bacterium]|nr:D-alanine--D-alanine ligase family protein [Candidatus Limnocylindria bacterium]
MTKRLRIGIVAGGRSAEHEVSVASAEAVLAAIDRERYEPYLVYIDRQGHWHLPAGPAPELAGGLAGLLGVDTPADHTAHLAEEASALPATVSEDALAPRTALRSLAEVIDVAFLVLHGPYGEDGTLQGFLELAGIPYTGAGVLASALAMDKIVFKDLMRGHDLPVVDYTWFRRSDWTDAPDAVLANVAARIGPRSVVKPARLGSSLGMSVVHGPDELPGAITEALRYDSKVIVEAYVANARELECGVLGNDQPQVFEPGEVRSHGEWYDYAAKYTEGLADVLPRADVSPVISRRVQELALAAYRAVDCAGFARVDFLVPEDAVYISEMNTIPGFTATSMFPKQAELAGIGFAQLVDRLVRLGLEREGPTDADEQLPDDSEDGR